MVNEDDADSASGSAGAVAAKLVKAAIEGRPPMARGFVKRKSRTEFCKPSLRFPGNANFRPRDQTAKPPLRLCRPLAEAFATPASPPIAGFA